MVLYFNVEADKNQIKQPKILKDVISSPINDEILQIIMHLLCFVRCFTVVFVSFTQDNNKAPRKKANQHPKIKVELSRDSEAQPEEDEMDEFTMKRILGTLSKDRDYLEKFLGDNGRCSDNVVNMFNNYVVTFSLGCVVLYKLLSENNVKADPKVLFYNVPRTSLTFRLFSYVPYYQKKSFYYRNTIMRLNCSFGSLYSSNIENQFLSQISENITLPGTTNVGSTAQNGLHFLYDRVLNWVRKGEAMPVTQPTPLPRETKNSAKRISMVHGSSGNAVCLTWLTIK